MLRMPLLPLLLRRLHGRLRNLHVRNVVRRGVGRHLVLCGVSLHLRVRHREPSARRVGTMLHLASVVCLSP